MNELKLSPSDGSVVFGQSLGMADHLTYPLGQLCGKGEGTVVMMRVWAPHHSTRGLPGQQSPPLRPHSRGSTISV